MIVCNLCSSKTRCVTHSIDGMEYDICEKCWKPLAEKLGGNGRLSRTRLDTVAVPHRQIMIEPREIEATPLPGVRPKTF